MNPLIEALTMLVGATDHVRKLAEAEAVGLTTAEIAQVEQLLKYSLHLLSKAGTEITLSSTIDRMLK